MPYIEFYPAPGQAVCVQIDDKADRMGLRYPVDVPLCGDAAATLRELLPLLERNENRAFLEQAQAGMHDWWELMEERGTRDDVPMKPQVPAWALNDVLAGNAIICGDSGTVTTDLARHVKIKKGMSFSFSGTNCSMAAGLPYAIGAQAAFPDRQVVVYTGDGSLTMQLGDFLTCVQHDLPVKIVVIKNNTLGLIKWEQMVFLGNPEYGVNMAPLDFVKFAEACGGYGVRVEQAADCTEAMRRAMEHEGPAIIEAVVDQHEPPMPAKVKPDQVKKLAAALKNGTPNRKHIAGQMIKDVLDESSFDASPSSAIPNPVAKIAQAVAHRLSDHD
jgi:pyruvate dehydrogenase (quinone)/pyruvate oxidase